MNRTRNMEALTQYNLEISLTFEAIKKFHGRNTSFTSRKYHITLLSKQKLVKCY